MYETFYGLHEPPFALTPDPRFLWLSETHQEGLAVLFYGITRRKGFLLLTGEVGSGKTTLLRAVLDKLPPETETALVFNTGELTTIDLFKLIAAEFRLRGNFETKADYIISLNTMLMERLQAGLNTVLIIDEAQNLPRKTLEEIRLLSNLETNSEKLLQIVLTGQPELRETMTSPDLRQLRQRVAVDHHVRPLRDDEVLPFLQHRLQIAGGDYDEIFGPGVEKIMYSYSLGCPRLISLLADRCLIAAFGKEIRPVPASFVERKSRELYEFRADVSQGKPELEI
jgi:general secretion pathway protein A